MYPSQRQAILIEADPVNAWNPTRAAAALNVVGASTSSSRATLSEAGAIYFNQTTGNNANPGTEASPKQTFAAAAATAGAGGVVVQLDSGALSVSGIIDVVLIADVGIAPTITATDTYVNTIDASAAITVTYNGTIAGGQWIANHNAAVFYGNANEVLVFNPDRTWSAATIAPIAGTITAATGIFGTGIVLATNSAARVVAGVGTAETPAVTTQPNRAWADLTNGVFISVHNSAGIQTRPALSGAQTWTARTAPATIGTANISTGCHGLYRNVALVEGGKAIYSDDAINWFQGFMPAAVSGIVYRGVAYGNGQYIAVGTGGAVLTSADGQNWTQGTSAGTQDLYAIDFDGDYFFVAGNAGTVWRSTDGTSWTAVTVAGGYGVTNGRACVVVQGYIITAGGTSIVQKAPVGLLMRESLAGYTTSNNVWLLFEATVTNTTRAAGNTINAALWCYTDNPGTATFANNYCENMFVTTGDVDPIVFSENLVSNDRIIFYTGGPVSFLKETVLGGVKIDKTPDTAPNNFTIRDVIIEGGIVAAGVVTVSSGNVRGYRSPGVVVSSPNVSDTTPLFVGSGPYRYALRRKADGFPTDSPLINRAVYYTYVSPTDGQVYARDIGAYSFDEQAPIENYTRSKYLPRPDAVSNRGSLRAIDQPLAYYANTRGGKVQGINRIDGAVERVAMSWKNFTAADYAWLKALFLEVESVKVRLTWNIEYAAASTVTANGATAAASSTIEINSAVVYPGSLAIHSGNQYRVARVYPSIDAATRLILEGETAALINNADNISIRQATGFGEYLIEWPTAIQKTPFTSREWSDFADVELSFVRKLE